MLTYILLLIILDLGCGNILDNDLLNVNVYSDYAYKIEESLRESEVSQDCKEQLSEYGKALLERQQWAIKMFDAGGKFPSGILEGNFAELGSFDECLSIDYNSIIGKYCLSNINFNISSEVSLKQQSVQTVEDPQFLDIIEKQERSTVSVNFQLAICVPNNCSAAELQTLYQKLYKGITIKEEGCQTTADQPQLNASSIAVISFFGIILWLMIVSTLYDGVFIYLRKENTTHPIFTSFSVISNGGKLFKTTKTDSRQISCVHGLRVISTMWVIIGHKYLTQNSLPMKNTFEAIRTLNNPGMMFMLQAPLSVDTFFLMSGLVTSYIYMTSMSKGIKFNIFLYYVHRYLRLTPLLIALILVYATLLEHLGSGPFWPNIAESLSKGCRNGWWKALLYIQNYGDLNMCIGQTWYLSADTQLFLLSPILLIPLSKWPKFALILTGLLTIGFMVACFLIAWYLELSAIGDRNNTRLYYMKYYYFTTHGRAASWFIGILVGYFIFQVKQKGRIPLSKGVIILLWMVCLVLLPTCVFAGHNLMSNEYNKVINSLHIALVRPVWAVAVGWLIYACAGGYGGPINWFLSLPIFQIVSRFTYSLYLVHFLIIHLTTSQMRTPPIVNNAYLMHLFWADFVYIFVVSAIFTLAFESPIIILEKIMFNRRSGKPSGSVDKNIKSIEAA